MIRGVIEEIYEVVGVGKESRVYLGLTPSGLRVAIKIFYPQNISFKKHKRYIFGDHRFSSFRNNPYHIVSLWCSKEYRNMIRAYKAGVNVPRPIAYYKNILVMEFLGEKSPAPLLREVVLENPGKFTDKYS